MLSSYGTLCKIFNKKATAKTPSKIPTTKNVNLYYGLIFVDSKTIG